MPQQTTSRYEIYSTTDEAWAAMYRAILGAEKSVYWEVYIFLDDEEGRNFFDLLEKKARQGVDVKLIIDSLGSFEVSRKRVQSLKDAGVDMHFFSERKHRYRGIWRSLFSRTHRKILIIDEQTGFIGGVNIDKQMKKWLDIHVRIEGKVVRSLLRAFAKTYLICGGEKKSVKHLLKYRFRNSPDNEVQFIYDEAHSGISRARKKYIEAFHKARERIILFSPYYIPDKRFLLALWQARKRGVKIDLLIPFRTDLRFLTYVAYSFFSLTKKFGVNIRLSKRMMHGKGVIMDDDWAMIGSSNIERTSFDDNYEANVQIRNKDVVKKMKETLDRWLSEAESLEDIKWDMRGRWHKIKEKIAHFTYHLWHRRH